MEILSLKTFKSVVDEGGVQAASKALHTVQSNVTARIKRLEDELGSPLFYRKGRGLELTPAGVTLVEYADKLLLLEQQAGVAVKQVGEVSGDLRIGSMESFAAARLPALLQAFRKHHPQVIPKVSTETSGELIQKVLNFKLDCAFVGGKVNHPDLHSEQVLVEELVLASAKTGSVPDTLIMLRDGCAYRDIAKRWLKDQGRVATTIMDMGTQEGILGCAAVGLGYTLLPRQIVADSRYIQDLKLQTISSDYSQVPTLMVTHKDAMQMGAINTLQQLFSAPFPEWESAA